MSNLIFSLNATMPIFLTMILGLFFRKVGILDESFTSKMNKFVFKIALTTHSELRKLKNSTPRT